jgi:hypothetical protein
VVDFLAELEASVAEWIAVLTTDMRVAHSESLFASDNTPTLAG